MPQPHPKGLSRCRFCDTLDTPRWRAALDTNGLCLLVK